MYTTRYSMILRIEEMPDLIITVVYWSIASEIYSSFKFGNQMNCAV